MRTTDGRSQMQKPSVLFSALVLLLFGCVSLYGVYVVVDWLLRQFSLVPKEILVPTVTVSVTAIVSVIGIILSKHLEQRNVITTELRKSKANVYVEFLETFFDVTKKNGTPEQYTDEQVKDLMNKITIQLIMWAGDSVFRDYIAWKRDTPIGSDDVAVGVRAILRMDALIRTMRREMGHKNNGIKTGDISRAYINDFDDALADLGLSHLLGGK